MKRDSTARAFVTVAVFLLVSGSLSLAQDTPTPELDRFLCPKPPTLTPSSDSLYRVCLLGLRTGLPRPFLYENLDTLEKLVADKNFSSDRFRTTSPLVAQWFLTHRSYFDSLKRVQATSDAAEKRQQREDLLKLGGFIVLALIAVAATLRAIFKGAVWFSGNIEPARKAVRSWHSGQLGAAWVAALLVEGMLYTWFRLAFEGHEDGWNTPFFPLIFLALLYLGLLGLMLRITWVWFGGRVESDVPRGRKNHERND